MPPFEDDEDEKPISTRDALVAAFDAFDAGDLTSENAHTFELKTDNTKRDADEAEAIGRKPDASAAAGADENSRDRARDNGGRFAKGEGEGEGQKPATDTKPEQGLKPDQRQQPGAQQEQGQQPAADAAPAAAAPQGLTPRASAIWDKATPEVREYITEREASLAQIADSMTPILNEAKVHNLPWNEYATRLVKADKFLRDTPMDAMLWLADSHGIDLDALADMAAAKRAGITLQPNAAQQQPHSDINRAVQPIASQVQEIRSQLQRREEAETRQQAEAQQARRNAVKREMDEFAAKQPHWNEVKEEVFALVPAVQKRLPNAGSITEIMTAAYERAIYANPEVRAKVLKEQQTKERDQRRHQQSRSLEGLTDHRGGPTAPAKPNGAAPSLRGEIEANWAAYDSR